MIRLILLLTLCFSVYNCFGQKANRRFVNSDNKCKDSWQYFSLQDTINGHVLFHAKAYFFCGDIAAASLTIIKTTSGDTIRVLELCNVNKDFKKSAIVKIAPSQQPTFGVVLPTDKDYNCIIKKTCYGLITLLTDKNK